MLSSDEDESDVKINDLWNTETEVDKDQEYEARVRNKTKKKLLTM